MYNHTTTTVAGLYNALRTVPDLHETPAIRSAREQRRAGRK
jgi:hypothetical protein